MNFKSPLFGLGFLTDEKIRVIEEHPQLGGAFFRGEINKTQLISNIQAFSSELIKNPSESARFSEDDLKRLMESLRKAPIARWEPIKPNPVKAPIVFWEQDNKSDLENIRFGNEYSPSLIFKNGVNVSSSIKLSKQMGFEVEIFESKNILMARMPSSDSVGLSLKGCQDSCGIAINNEKINSMVIADGVGQGICSQSIAKIAVKYALLELEKIKNFEKIHAIKLIENVEEKIHKSFNESIISNDVTQRKKAPEASYFLDIIKDGDIGATTLLCSYLKDSILHLCILGDGGFLIVNRNKIVKSGGGQAKGKPPQISGNSKNKKKKVDLGVIIYDEVQLSKGDLVIMFSDGLLKKGQTIGIIAAAVKSSLQQNKNLLEIFERISKGLIGIDDISAIIFEFN